MKHEDIETRTHSPRGEYAANDANYARLLSRLKSAPPVRNATPRGWMHKWGVAASVAVVCGLAWAATSQMAGWTTPKADEAPAAATEAPAAPQALTFADTPLSQVLSALGDKYGVEVAPIGPDADINITATFAPDETLDEALEALSLVAGLDFATEGGRIVTKQ